MKLTKVTMLGLGVLLPGLATLACSTGSSTGSEGPASTEVGAPRDVTVEKSGVLNQMLSTDGSSTQFYLESNGTWTRLNGMHPPADLINLEVVVKGYQASASAPLTAIDITPAAPAASGDVRSKNQKYFSNTADPGTLAVILVKDPSLTTPPISEAELLAEWQTNSNSAEAYFNEASAGQYGLDIDFFGWYDVDLSNCNNNYTAPGQDALNQAIAQDGLDQDAYQLATFVLIRDGDPCFGGGGWGSYSNGRSWSDTNNATIYAHEIGHNLGLLHSSGIICRDHDGGFLSDSGQCYRQEYHDPLDIMGWHTEFRHFNAFRKVQLGWIPESNELEVSSSGQFVVEPQEASTSGIQSLLVPIAGTDEYFHIEVRDGSGFDSGLEDFVLLRKVRKDLSPSTPHTGFQTYLIDVNPTANFFDAGEDMKSSSLQVGQTYHDQPTGTSFELVGFNGDAAIVNVTVDGPSCDDGTQNGPETGVDCGGTCGACPTGQGCNEHWDCEDYSCEAGTCVDATGGGLVAEYFADTSFSSSLGTYTVPTVDFDAHLSSPPNINRSDDFAIRYTGSITPRYSEEYTFTTTSDDRVRLWVNDQLLIDDTYGTYTGSITLVADESYEFKFEFEEYGGAALAQLRWESASQAQEVVPKNRLSPAGASGDCTVATGIQLGGHASTTTVASNACVVISNYPFWWQWANPTLRVQTGAGGNYPVDFTYEDSCGDESGNGSFTSAWQQQEFGSPTSSCPMAIQLLGDGSSINLTWY